MPSRTSRIKRSQCRTATLILAAALLACALTASACEVDTGAICPAPPVRPVDIGAPAPQAPAASITLELSRNYLTERIKALTASGPNDDSGADVTNVTLSDTGTGTGGGEITMTIRPWVRGSDGMPAPPRALL